MTHDSQAWALRARGQILNATSERFIVAAPLFHMNGLFSTKLGFFIGASVVMQPGFTSSGEARSGRAANSTTAIDGIGAR